MRYTACTDRAIQCTQAPIVVRNCAIGLYERDIPQWDDVEIV